MASDLDTLSGSFSDDDSWGMTAGPNDDLVKIVYIADTHNGHGVRRFREKIEEMEGDILIHAGDLSEHGTLEEVRSAFEWLCSLENFTHKVFIAGNMDGKVAKDLQTMSSTRHNVIYLENSSCEVRGLKIYGCPYTPRFCGDLQYDRLSEEARQIWKKIPKDCDILVSHGPPAGILDTNSKGKQIGCEDMLKAIQRRPCLKAVIFGHVHHSYGVVQKDKLFINAAQYNGIFHNVVHNKPYQFWMRSDDKATFYLADDVAKL